VQVLGVESLAKIGSGRSFASILDHVSPTNRFDVIIGSPVRDNGSGVAYQLCYAIRLPHRNVPVWIEDTGRWFAGPDGKPSRAAGVVRVITERYLREQRLAELSATDALTGEMNRDRLCKHLDDMLERATRLRSSIGLLLIGIDELSRVNRSYGFNVADQAIRAVAERLRARKRASDIIGRFSDTKFGIVLNDCSPDDLAVAASRFVNAVRETPIETPAGPLTISVTAGGIIAPRHARDMHEMISGALEALQLAREGGRGTFRVYQPSIESEARRKENVRLTDLIVSALNDRRVKLAFQPVVGAKTRQVVFQECLVRVSEPCGREIDAMTILTVAEKLDLVRLIDHRVMELAASELRANPDLVLSLNVSASTVRDPVWLATFAAEMRNNIGSRLIVEITESAAIQDVEAARRFVARVKGFGCKVAIDDFGAGYTSFRNLRRLGVDMVKIDGSFVANLETAPDDRVFVRALLELARELGLETVAEWVQSEDAAATLVDWGCDYFQGALVGLAETRAASPDEEKAAEAAFAG
jgi:diguanylate cyclase (GGDEF)-like protein